MRAVHPEPVEGSKSERAHHPSAPPPSRSRERAIHLAETWIHNAGLYEPTEESLADALFDHQLSADLTAVHVERRIPALATEDDDGQALALPVRSGTEAPLVTLGVDENHLLPGLEQLLGQPARVRQRSGPRWGRPA